MTFDAFTPHPVCHALADWHFGLTVPEPWPTPVGLIVGEAPGPQTHAALPMWPFPAGSAGARLLRMSGMSTRDYLTRLARVNLIHDYARRWDGVAARRRMSWILRELPMGGRALLLGYRVGQAFSDVTGVSHVRFGVQITGDREIAWAPHPSGRNSEYNDATSRAVLGSLVRWTARVAR